MIQIKKIKFYYIKSIIISLRFVPLGLASLRPTSLGPASAGPSDSGAGVVMEIDEGASTFEVDYKCEHHHLSPSVISAIIKI